MKINTIILILMLTVSQGICADKLTVALRNDAPPLAFVNVDGKPVGMYVDIWKLWAEKTGLKIEFRAEILQDTLESLKNGTADIHSALNYSKERTQWIAFSRPFYEISLCVFFPKNQEKIHHIRELKGQKAGVIGSPHEKILRKDYPEIEFIPFAVVEDMIQAAREGKIRAFVGSPPIILMTLYRMGLAGEFESTDEIFFAQKVYAGVLKHNTELLALVNKGFDAISHKELADIEARWIPDPEKRYYNPHSKIIRLTEQEQAWIKSHNPIRVGTGRIFPPFHFVENNEPIGIVPDYLHLISERTGIRFELIPIEWNNVDTIAKNRDIDLHLTNAIPYRQEWMNFTEPLFNADFVIVSRNDMPFVSHLSSLKGKTAAMLKGLPFYEEIQKNYPEIKPYPANNTSEAIEAVVSGKADVYIGSLIGAAYQIQKYHFSDLKIAGLTDFSHQPMMFAVRNDWDKAIQIINKGIVSINKHDHEVIYQKWFPVRFEHTVDWSVVIRWVSGIGSFFIIILGISLFWNRRLAREIVERRQAEMLLRNSKERYWRISSVISDIAYSCLEIEDGGYAIDWITGATERITGCSADEIKANRCWRMFVIEDDLALFDKHVVGLAPGESSSCELRLRHKDGSVRWTASSAECVLSSANPRTQRLYGGLVDITDRKQLEEKRLELERQILNVQKMESLGRISAGIAHNFNNILYAVTGNIELAMDDVPPESSTLRILEEALKAAERAVNLTHKILAYSGSGFFKFGKVDVSRLIKENVHTFTSVISETVSFSLNLTEDIPLINAAPEQIQRILMNILVNASEAVGENPGTVTLSTGVTDCDDASLKNGLQDIDEPEEKPIAGRCVYIEISDTGCGMSEETVKLLSDPFFTTKFMGRGLGMSEVQGIVRNHKGMILVNSEPNRGTTIRVLFPVLEAT